MPVLCDLGSFCPNVTFLNLHQCVRTRRPRRCDAEHSLPPLPYSAPSNNLTTTADIHNFPNLRWVNMSSNNLKEVNEDLCKCRNLVEVDLAYNNLRNPKSIMQLADLPHLRRLDLSQNDFSESDKNRILSFFRPRNPQCKVVFTSELTGVAAEEAAQESGGGSCCAVQ